MTITNGNYKAEITKTTNGYGEKVFRVKVLCMTGTYIEGDVRYMKEFASEKRATNAAKRELNKWA